MNDDVKKEYFELVNKLNQSNKVKNQNTEVFFFIESDDSGIEKLFAAISEGQKILLLERLTKDFGE